MSQDLLWRRFTCSLACYSPVFSCYFNKGKEPESFAEKVFRLFWTEKFLFFTCYQEQPGLLVIKNKLDSCTRFPIYVYTRIRVNVWPLAVSDKSKPCRHQFTSIPAHGFDYRFDYLQTILSYVFWVLTSP